MSKVPWNTWSVPSINERSYSSFDTIDGCYEDVDTVSDLEDFDTCNGHSYFEDGKPDNNLYAEHSLESLPILRSIDEFDSSAIFDKSRVDDFDDFKGIVAIPDDDWDTRWDSEKSDSESSIVFDEFKDVDDLPDDDFESDI
ncbi:hypothetical protein BGZ98_003683 [Dissophora globulifera]|nr:hypothetical protein BGZ98_003683 [Dissophora globulifera]